MSDKNNAGTVWIRKHTRRRLSAVLAVVIACAATLEFGVGVAAADPTAPPVPVQPVLPFPIPPVPPELDPGFYSPAPEVVASKQPGEIIAAREVHLAFYSIVPFNIDAWQLSYRSTNTRDEPIAAVTTVMKPRGDNAGRPRNLLSYQFSEDSNAQYCSPSYALQQASIPGFYTTQYVIPYEFILPISALGAGWAVAMPDHEGPRSAFGDGPLGARIAMDGMRAAENFVPMGLSRETEIGAAGYSGGALPTGHLAEMHASYAPELNIVGVAEGGNLPDLRAAMELANGNLASGLIAGGILGIAREEPEFDAFIQQHINPVARAVIPVKNALCWSSAAILPFLNTKGLFDVPNLYDQPRVAAVLERMRQGHSTPDMPVFIYHSNPDWVAPVGPVNQLVQQYCADPNARVQYVRDNFSEHLSLQIAGMARVLLWLKDRFDGVPVPNGCTVHDEGAMNLDPATWPEWLRGAGDLLAGLLQQPIGTR
ncbi:lipase family protein [Nocardia sp. CA-128927]|uniref:lipase family protein n=1 Tax=Nocardia sp. CA-128927 TaxID=3239975 RepID=UPI003D96FA8B